MIRALLKPAVYGSSSLRTNQDIAIAELGLSGYPSPALSVHALSDRQVGCGHGLQGRVCENAMVEIGRTAVLLHVRELGI